MHVWDLSRKTFTSHITNKTNYYCFAIRTSGSNHLSKGFCSSKTCFVSGSVHRCLERLVGPRKTVPPFSGNFSVEAPAMICPEYASRYKQLGFVQVLIAWLTPIIAMKTIMVHPFRPGSQWNAIAFHVSIILKDFINEITLTPSGNDVCPNILNIYIFCTASVPIGNCDEN